MSNLTHIAEDGLRLLTICVGGLLIYASVFLYETEKGHITLTGAISQCIIAEMAALAGMWASLVA